ncbi:hypothetical protein PMAYCL1PPCAC_07992, partial [Pristionchus mayeri]
SVILIVNCPTGPMLVFTSTSCSIDSVSISFRRPGNTSGVTSPRSPSSRVSSMARLPSNTNDVASSRRSSSTTQSAMPSRGRCSGFNDSDCRLEVLSFERFPDCAFSFTSSNG